MLLLIYSFFRYICTRFHYLLSLDNDVLETSKRRAMFYNILSQNFIVKCFTKSLLIRILLFGRYSLQLDNNINYLTIFHIKTVTRMARTLARNPGGGHFRNFWVGM